MLKFKVKEVLEQRGIFHPHNWLTNHLDLCRTSSTRLLNGTQNSLLLDHFDMLCRELNCDVNDLVYYVQDGRQKPLNPGHKLLELKPPSLITDWRTLLEKMEPQKVTEFSKMLNAGLVNKV